MDKENIDPQLLPYLLNEKQAKKGRAFQDLTHKYRKKENKKVPSVSSKMETIFNSTYQSSDAFQNTENISLPFYMDNQNDSTLPPMEEEDIRAMNEEFDMLLESVATSDLMEENKIANNNSQKSSSSKSNTNDKRNSENQNSLKRPALQDITSNVVTKDLLDDPEFDPVEVFFDDTNVVEEGIENINFGDERRTKSTDDIDVHYGRNRIQGIGPEDILEDSDISSSEELNGISSLDKRTFQNTPRRNNQLKECSRTCNAVRPIRDKSALLANDRQHRPVKKKNPSKKFGTNATNRLNSKENSLDGMNKLDSDHPKQKKKVSLLTKETHKKKSLKKNVIEMQEHELFTNNIENVISLTSDLEFAVENFRKLKILTSTQSRSEKNFRSSQSRGTPQHNHSTKVPELPQSFSIRSIR